MKSPPSRGRLTVLVLFVLGATMPAVVNIASAGAATPTPATSRVTFGIAPASATGADGRAHFTFGATPGAVLFDHVSLLNYASVPLTLQVYARDAQEATGGGFGLLPAAATSLGVGAWISGPPGDAAVQVPPRTAKGQPGQTVVPFTMRVPGRAPHRATTWAESSPPCRPWGRMPRDSRSSWISGLRPGCSFGSPARFRLRSRCRRSAMPTAEQRTRSDGARSRCTTSLPTPATSTSD